MANDTCDKATRINLTAGHIDMPVTTVGAVANLAAPCATGPSADVFFTFTLTQRELVYADTFGAGWNTTLFFASSCTKAITTSTTAGDVLCSDDACTSTQSQVVALLAQGTYYLVVGGGEGTGTLHVEHVPVGGNAPVAQLAKGASTPTGTTSTQCSVCACEASGGESAFWWKTCPADATGALTVSTCNGATFDTVLSLQIPQISADPTCNGDDETCAPRSTLTGTIPAGAGLFVVGVLGDLANDHGPFTLTSNRP